MQDALLTDCLPPLTVRVDKRRCLTWAAAFSCDKGEAVPAQPVDALMIHSARRQYSASADKIAARIVNCAQAVRQDLAHARPAGPAARQLAADAQALLEALAELRAVERLAAWTRQSAA